VTSELTAYQSDSQNRPPETIRRLEFLAASRQIGQVFAESANFLGLPFAIPMQTKLEEMPRFERDSRNVRNLQAHIIEGYERARYPSSPRLGHDNIIGAELHVAVMSAKMSCFVSSNTIS
jgi:hypothetical protein